MSPRALSREKRPKIPAVSILALAVVVTALLFAAGGGRAGVGLLFMAGGLGFLLYPPDQKMPGSWWAVGVGLLAFCIGSFIPGLSLLSGEWRGEMSEVYGIQTASSLTPQPWITFDATLFLLFGVLLFGHWSLHAPDSASRRQILRLFALVLFVFSMLVLVFYYGKISFPGWNSPRHLGPFENRNQLSSLLAVSLLVLVALFSNDIKKHRGWALVWGVAAVLQFYLLVLNYSRAGVVLLFLGGLVWMGLNFEYGRGKGRWALVFVVLALLLSSFFIFGGETLARFEKSTDGMDFAGSTRLAIQEDALGMIKDQAWGGVGLGNFSEVFPQYRNVFQSDSFVRHPESDWLWLAAETGIPWLLIFVAVGMLWGCRVFPLKSGSDKHFRSICLVAVLMVVIHGLVDVPLHRVGVLVPVLFLASMALPQPPSVPAGAWIKKGWMLLGGSACLWGLMTLAETADLLSKPGVTRVKKTVEKLPGLWGESRWDEGLALIGPALGSAPMDWELYYWRALFLLKSGDVSGARDDFRRARFLEKTSSDLPMNESLQWLPVRSDLAVAAANEMLRRSRYGTEVKYRVVADEAVRLGNKEAVEQLRFLARSYPELQHYYMESAPEEEFDLWLNDEEQTARHQKAYWFWDLLRKRKSGEAILDWASGHPSRLNLHYPHLAGILAEKKEWERAYLLVKNHMPPAVFPELEASEEAGKEAEKKYLLYPGDYAAACQVIQADMKEGRFHVAITKILPVLEKKDVPAYFYYLAAKAYEGSGDWEKACRSILRYDSLRDGPKK